MASVKDFPARGQVIEVREGMVVFRPERATYRLHLKIDGTYDGPVNQPIEGFIHARAQKVWTVSSGGLWVAPIMGTPRTVQGRVLLIEGNQIVVHAGTPYVIELPEADSAMSLLAGAITLNQMVNVIVHSGTRFEWLNEMAAV